MSNDINTFKGHIDNYLKNRAGGGLYESASDSLPRYLLQQLCRRGRSR